MKFDFVIGNPPYQEEAENKSQTNGQAVHNNIFQHFQITADEVSKNGSVMIYPGGRWIHRFGKGLAEFGKKLINDKSVSKIVFFPESTEVFGNVANLSDGITIVVKNKSKKRDGFEYIYIKEGKQEQIKAKNPGDDVIPLDPRDIRISEKILNYMRANNILCLRESKPMRGDNLFGIDSDFVEKNPGKVTELQNSKNIDWGKHIKLLTNDKAGKAGRAKWYLAQRNIVTKNARYIDEWQVIVSSANAGGQKRDNQIEIADNHSAFGRARLSLKSFLTKTEAVNFYNYCKSYFIRFAFLLTDESIASLGKLVPDFGDYTNKNKKLDFSKPLDSQLSKLFNLSESDEKYIVERVENMRKGKTDA